MLQINSENENIKLENKQGKQKPNLYLYIYSPYKANLGNKLYTCESSTSCFINYPHNLPPIVASSH